MTEPTRCVHGYTSPLLLCIDCIDVDRDLLRLKLEKRQTDIELLTHTVEALTKELRAIREDFEQEKEDRDELLKQLKTAWDETTQEKENRVKYQNIVYQICRQLDSALGHDIRTKRVSIYDVEETLAKILAERKSPEVKS